jgi:hypothetical protein
MFGNIRDVRSASKGPSGSAIKMNIFANMDNGTAALILQLQLEDSNELFESFEGKGKGREGVLSDSQIAFQTDVPLEPNSATLAANTGRLAHVHNGTKTGSLRERTRSLHLNLFESTLRSRKLELLLSFKVFGTLTSTITRRGSIFGAHISVKSAIMYCLHTFLSADSAIFRLAIGAKGTGFDATATFELAGKGECA